jgi:hypothetical protein
MFFSSPGPLLLDLRRFYFYFSVSGDFRKMRAGAVRIREADAVGAGAVLLPAGGIILPSERSIFLFAG